MMNGQKTFINTTARDVLLEFIACDIKWNGTIKKIAKRKIYFIQGNVNSYSKMPKNPERLKVIKDHFEFVATVEVVSTEADD